MLKTLCRTITMELVALRLYLGPLFFITPDSQQHFRIFASLFRDGSWFHPGRSHSPKLTDDDAAEHL